MREVLLLVLLGEGLLCLPNPPHTFQTLGSQRISGRVMGGGSSEPLSFRAPAIGKALCKVLFLVYLRY